MRENAHSNGKEIAVQNRSRTPLLAVLIAIFSTALFFEPVEARELSETLLISEVPEIVETQEGDMASEFSDIEGTIYEAAVTELARMNIFSGYGDGTFLPENFISRAETAKIAVSMVDLPEYSGPPNFFEDTKGHWARGYIDCACAMGAMKGRNTATFSPLDKVTHAEICTVLLRLSGYTDISLGGTWPYNYMEKAKELGLFEGIETNERGNINATRGEVALMTAKLAEDIRRNWQEGYEEFAGKTYKAPLGDRLDNFSGIALGFPVSYSVVLEYEGSIPVAKRQVALFLNGEILRLRGDADNRDIVIRLKDGKFSLSGDLYAFQIFKGKLIKTHIADGSVLSHFEDLSAGFGKIEKVSENGIKIEGIDELILPAKRAVFYNAIYDDGILITYEVDSSNSATAGDHLRAWDVDAREEGKAEVILFIKADAAADAMRAGHIVPHEQSEVP